MESLAPTRIQLRVVKGGIQTSCNFFSILQNQVLQTVPVFIFYQPVRPSQHNILLLLANDRFLPLNSKFLSHLWLFTSDSAYDLLGRSFSPTQGRHQIKIMKAALPWLLKYDILWLITPHNSHCLHIKDATLRSQKVLHWNWPTRIYFAQTLGNAEEQLPTKASILQGRRQW